MKMLKLKSSLLLAIYLLAVSSFITAYSQTTDEKIFADVPVTQRAHLIARLNLYIEYVLARQQEKIRELYDAETLCTLCLGKKECVENCSPPMVPDVPKGFNSRVIELKPTSIELIKGQLDKYKIKANQTERVDYYGNGKYRIWKKKVSIETTFQNGEWYFSLIAEPGN